MDLRSEEIRGDFLPKSGLDSKEKKRRRRQEREEKIAATKETIRQHETYGDLKVSRRIPEKVVLEVIARDTGRDFGRPGHKCERPGPPHHIVNFEKFLKGEIKSDPHTVDNLEAPCAACHKLAHEMGIPSGTSIEDFFREKFNNPKNK